MNLIGMMQRISPAACGIVYNQLPRFGTLNSSVSRKIKNSYKPVLSCFYGLRIVSGLPVSLFILFKIFFTILFFNLLDFEID